MPNINPQIPRTTGQRGIHYLPAMRLRDNKRIGGSYAYDGTTQAKGTLYPGGLVGMLSPSGAAHSYYATEYNITEDFAYDLEYYTSNEVKYKTAEAYFQNYRRLKSLQIGFMQTDYIPSSPSLMNSGTMILRKVFPVSTTGIFMVFKQTGGTAGLYGAAATINATTGALTWGTPVVLSSTTVTGMIDGTVDCVDISSGSVGSKFAIAWQATATTVRQIVVTISGTTVTAGTAADQTIVSSTLGNSASLRMVRVTTDTFMIAWYHSTVTKTRVWVCTVATTTITVGAISDAFAAANVSYTQIAMASGSSTSGILAGALGNVLQLQCFTLSGTTVTLGTTVNTYNGAAISSTWNFFDGATWYSNILPLSASTYAITNANSGSGAIAYVSFTGTTPTVNAIDSSIIPVSSSYNNYSDLYQVDSTHWAMYTYNNTLGWDGLTTFDYDSTSGKVSAARNNTTNGTTRNLVFKTAPSSAGTTYTGICKVGSQYVMIGSATNVNPIWAGIGHVGSCEVYFEGEGTAAATLTSPYYGWAYTRQTVGKAIGKPVAYFSLKNTIGSAQFIRTLDWNFEVD